MHNYQRGVAMVGGRPHRSTLMVWGTSTNDDVVIDEACERTENFHIGWTQKE